MGIQSGKISVIYDDDPRLADVWKGKPGETREMEESSSGGGNDGGSTSPSRPQLSDIVVKDFIKYKDKGIEKVKVVLRIYNSSSESIDGFSFALTKPDAQGGRA
jgi:hypothetical protein